MRKYQFITLFFLILLSQTAFSQIPDFHKNQFSSDNLQFNANYAISSDNLNNQFLLKILQGGYLSTEIRTSSYNQLKDVNTLGNRSGHSILYTQKLDSLFSRDNFYFTAAYGKERLSEISFSSDLFHLIMFGNKSTAGEILDIANTNFLNFEQQYFKMGLAKEVKTQNFTHQFHFMLGLHLGNQYSHIQTDKNAFLLTDTSGSAIASNINLSYASSSSSFEKFQIAAKGISLNFSYNVKFKKHQFFFAAENIGKLYWNNKTEHFNKDTALVFQGLEIDNIFESDSILFDDILKDYGLELKHNSLQTYIPFHLRFGWEYELNNRINIRLLVQDYIHSQYKTHFCLEADYKLNEAICLTPIISYGAYANFNYGLAYSHFIKKLGLRFEAQTNYIDGLIFADKKAAFGGELKIVKHFGQCDTK